MAQRAGGLMRFEIGIVFEHPEFWLLAIRSQIAVLHRANEEEHRAAGEHSKKK